MAAADPPVDLSIRAEPVRERFEARYAAREAGLSACKEAIRAAANAIRAQHRGDDGRAGQLLGVSRQALDAAVSAVDPYPELLHAGFVQDAAKEYAEAVLTAAAVAGRPWPAPEDVGVDDASWLHGLAESVGELRRRCLDEVRADRFREAARLLDLMEEVMAVLATIDVPDGLTRGLRRATDAARAITERTRGDVTTAVGQHRLREALDAHRAVLIRGGGVGEG